MAPRKFFSEEFDQLFDVLFDSSTWDEIPAFPIVSQLPKYLAAEFPPCDLEVSEDKSLTYRFAVAGYPEKDISVSYEDDHLILKLNAQTDGDSTSKFIQKRIKRGEVVAKYYVPMSKYDVTKIKGSLKDGILTVHIPVSEDRKLSVIQISKE